MVCRTCDHTMQRVNEGIKPKVFWCPRCGTLKSEDCVPEFAKPKTVERLVRWADDLLQVANELEHEAKTRIQRIDAAIHEVCCVQKE